MVDGMGERRVTLPRTPLILGTPEGSGMSASSESDSVAVLPWLWSREQLLK